jgi:cofilin
MIYSSSKDALRKSLNGIALEVQGTDYDEVSEASGVSPVLNGACGTPPSVRAPG